MTQIDDLLSALSEPTRLRALQITWDGYEHCVCEVMDRLGATQSRIAWHMARLSPGQPRVLTGIAKMRRGREVPHRRAKGIATLEQEVAAAPTAADKLQLLPSLIGKLSEASIVAPSWTGRKDAAVRGRRKLKAETEAR